jgi:hypothetical protein
MPGKVFLRRIEGAAVFLSQGAAKAAKGYLDRPIETALKVVSVIEKGPNPKTYEEIAEEARLTIDTVGAIVRAIKKGGYPLEIRKKKGSGSGTGRKPFLVSKKKTTE